MVYRAGFAVESSEYHILYERHSEDSDEDARGPYERHFAPRDGQTAYAQYKEWLAADLEVVVIDESKTVNYQPLENALEAVRTQLYSIEKECREYFGIEQFDRTTLLLSGPGNYRERIATVAPYKGNRDPEHKPHWYQQIRNYLTSEWGARVVTGREADDECSILGWQHLDQGGTDYVIATIDKDLDQIPGWHYNYHKQVFYRQSPDSAEQFLWQQCLSGDATDGIPGCTKIGEVRAKRLIDDWLDAAARSNKPGIPASAAQAIWAGIVEQYRKSRDQKGCPYVGRDPAAVALEMARLVYLQHYEGELWTPPGAPKELLEEYTDG